MAESALTELRERLDLNGVHADPVRVASAILGLARLQNWSAHPERMQEWIERLALESVKGNAELTPCPAPAVRPQSPAASPPQRPSAAG